MIAAFSEATAALKPGEISQPVETQYGYPHHPAPAVRRSAKASSTRSTPTPARVADSTYLAQRGTTSNVQVKDNAPSAIKDAVKEQAKHRNDKTVLATYKGGTLTVARVPRLARERSRRSSRCAAHSAGAGFDAQAVREAVAVQELLLHRADSAQDRHPGRREGAMYTQIGQLVGNVWQALGVDPKMLADSAKSTAEKERLAASRVDAYLDRMMAGQAQPISVPPPLKKILDAKYESSVNSAGIDRAFERAQKVRAVG